MKNPHNRLTRSLLIGAFATAGVSLAFGQSTNANANKPTVVTPPAVKDGSNASRAPTPAARPLDDTKGPDGRAIDPAPAGTPEPPSAPANVHIKSDRAGSAATAAAPAPVDPSSLPTGRATAAVSAALEPATFAPTIRSATVTTRDTVLADVESRMSSAESAMTSLGKTTSEMSAEGRQQFKAAASEVKEKARALRKSAQAARQANEQEWTSAREQLAADYEAYAAALAKIDAAAGTTPTIR